MTQIDLEGYREVVGYPEYLIKEYGIVWDTRQSKHLSWIKNNDFNCVNMYAQGGKKELVKIHHAVAKAFLTKPENATKIVMHIDLNRDNNHYSNLAWKVKGVSHQALLRYSNYHGVKYHLTELEEISEKSGLPLYTVRNRLEAGYTVEEIFQGYKHSSVFWIDDMKFIGEYEVKKYLDMIDRDSYRKERELAKCEIRHSRFIEESDRLQQEKELQERIKKRGTEDQDVIDAAISTWKGMMDRCYDIDRRDYQKYGAKGVTVCDTWHDRDNFCGWYVKNKIGDWDMDKDFLQGGVPTNKKVYSPSTCCFVPKYLNQWFVKRGLPIINRAGEQSYIEISSRVELFPLRKRLVGNSVEDVLEQWYLFKELQLEKRVLKMLSEYENIKRNYPNSPEIHPTLIKLLGSFSMEKYLST